MRIGSVSAGGWLFGSLLVMGCSDSPGEASRDLGTRGSSQNDDGNTPGGDGSGNGGSSSSTGGTPPGSGDTSDATSFCVEEINRYRATVGAKALVRWNAGEQCTADQCRADAESKKAHGEFGKCGEFAQNECPGWGGWKGDPKTVLQKCLESMWDEGPGGGHYENMKGTRYTKVACSFYKDGSGNVTAIQNFR